MRLIAAGIAALALALTACGDDSETEVPDRSGFLADIDPDNLNPEVARLALEYGESMCEAFDNADTQATAALLLDDDPDMAPAVMAAAVTYLCPRHQADIDELIDNLLKP